LFGVHLLVLVLVSSSSFITTLVASYLLTLTKLPDHDDLLTVIGWLN